LHECGESVETKRQAPLGSEIISQGEDIVLPSQ